MARWRRERVDAELAGAIAERGAGAEPVLAGGRDLPDVLLEWYGLPIAIDAAFEGSTARRDVEARARGRLAQSPIAVALLYPRHLSGCEDLRAQVRAGTMRVRCFAPTGAGPWTAVRGTDGLLATFDAARRRLTDEDAVERCAERLRAAVEVFVRAARFRTGRTDALLELVTVTDAAGAGDGTGDGKAALAAARICGLAVCTATMVQAELSGADPGVPRLPAPHDGAWRRALAASWTRALAHGYAAVFATALDVLEALEDAREVDAALGQVVQAASAVVSEHVLGRHDLVGRVYHRLLADKKYLATYYTSVPAAVLLAHLTLERLDGVDWAAEPGSLDLRLGDLACGTGTLLAAAAGVARSRWAGHRARAHRAVDPQALGKRLVEECLWGFDVLAYAVQVCAATLLLATPGAAVERTRIHRMPFGGEAGRLGSLELLAGGADVGLPPLDAVLMNPPFTRSVGGSQLLGSLRGADHTLARRSLAELVRRPDVHGNLNAGLGAPFVELAHRAVRPGGRLGLVLPKTVLTGQSWEPTRRLLAEHWHVEYVVVSHEPGRWNFSDSTDLSEALLVARKLRAGESTTGAVTTWVQLSENPRTPVAALAVHHALRSGARAGGAGIRVDGTLEEVGEMFTRPAPASGAPWRHGTFSRAGLDAVASAIAGCRPVPLPGAGPPVTIPLRTLGALGGIGPERRDLHDGFAVAGGAPGYPALWGHDAGQVTRLAQETNRRLRPRPAPLPGRPSKDAESLWRGAGPLLVAERFRLNSHRCVAVTLPRRALSNTWWTVDLAGDDAVDDGRIVGLWLNSTLGLLSYAYLAEETQGPWIGMKKNKLRDLAVLDPQALDERARAALLGRWDELAALDLRPAAQASADPARARIDAAVGQALGIPGDVLEGLRRLFGGEPRLGAVPAVRASRSGGGPAWGRCEDSDDGGAS